MIIFGPERPTDADRYIADTRANTAHIRRLMQQLHRDTA